MCGMAKDSQIRLSPENKRQLNALKKRVRMKISLATLGNEAINLGLPLLSKNIYGANNHETPQQEPAR